MEILYECEEMYGRPVYICYAGCHRHTSRYTAFVNEDSDVMDYCDKCVRDLPFLGVTMHIVITIEPVVYTVYSEHGRSMIDRILPPHDFHTTKL